MLRLLALTALLVLFPAFGYLAASVMCFYVVAVQSDEVLIGWFRG